jgi:hypothetical protein
LRERTGLAAGDGRVSGAISLVVGFDDSASARRALTWAANMLRGGSRRAARHTIGSVPGRLLRRSPYPVLTVS